MSILPVNLADAVKQCDYRTLIGFGDVTSDLSSGIGCIIAVLGGEPEPLSQEFRQEAIDCLLAGKTVLLISDQAKLRDAAKAELMALVQLLRTAGARA